MTVTSYDTSAAGVATIDDMSVNVLPSAAGPAPVVRYTCIANLSTNAGWFSLGDGKWCYLPPASSATVPHVVALDHPHTLPAGIQIKRVAGGGNITVHAFQY